MLDQNNCFQYECCGIDDYTDYATASNWDNVRTYEENGFDVEKILVTPVACCLMEGEFPDVEPKDEECATHPTDLTSNWRTVSQTGNIVIATRCQIFILV